MITTLQTISVVAGSTRAYTIQTPNGDGTYGAGFVSTDVISAVVRAADSEVSLATPAVVWGSSTVTVTNGAAVTLWTITLSPTDAAGLAPGIYHLQVFGTHSATTACLFDGLCQVISAAGTTVPSPPDLITAQYALAALAPMNFQEYNHEVIPTYISAASSLIRRWCMDRDFFVNTYTEEQEVSLNGEIRLNQVPVNVITRIQGNPQTALTITNTSSSVQFAQVYFAYTGQYGGYGTNLQTITGLTLSAVSNGVPALQTITFSVGEIISTLASAITGLGGGWNAVADSALGSWPVTELIGAFTALPAGINSQSGTGAQLKVYAQDLNAYIRDQWSGIVWTGAEYAGLGPRWGPDWQQYEGNRVTGGTVRCTYSAGFTTIPPEIQQACAETVKVMIERMNRSTILQSERLGQYSYTLSNELYWALPQPVRQTIGSYRLIRA